MQSSLRLKFFINVQKANLIILNEGFADNKRKLKKKIFVILLGLSVLVVVLGLNVLSSENEYKH